MISQETIEEVKTRARLVDLVSQRTPLRQRGLNYVGLCPFHQEKTPSFQVRDADNYYHCFGCGASGNAITFVMETQGLSFPDAVEDLAQRFGIEVRRTGGRPSSTDGIDRGRLFDATRLACAFFRRQLEAALNSPGHRLAEYLKSRGLRGEALRTFGIGFSPPGWTDLIAFLKSKGVAEEEILAAGLARRSSKGELYDAFRGRLIFPVWIDERRAAGFGGRHVPGLIPEDRPSEAPKYLNSQETAIYQKSRILYGLPQAVSTLRQRREVFLVEGYLDVIGLWQAGVQNSVAACGTAVGADHARRLRTLVDRVHLLFDGDAAGRAAASRAFEGFINSGLDVSAVFLPEGEDPDSLALSLGNGVSAFLEERKRSAKTLLDCLIDGLLEKQGAASARALGPAGKGRLCEGLGRSLNMVESPVERADLCARAAVRLGVERSHLEEILSRAAEGRPPLDLRIEDPGSAPDPQGPDEGQGRAVEDLPLLDRSIIQAVIARKETLAERVLRDPQIMQEISPPSRLFLEGLAEILALDGASADEKRRRIRSLLTDLGPSWLTFWRKTYAMLEDESVDPDRLYAECCTAVKRKRLSQSLRDLQSLIDASVDDERLGDLLQKKVALNRQIQALRPTEIRPE